MQSNTFFRSLLVQTKNFVGVIQKPLPGITSDKKWTKILVTYNNEEIIMYWKFDDESVQKATGQITPRSTDENAKVPISTEVILGSPISYASPNIEYKKLFVWDKALENHAIKLLFSQSGEYKNG